MNSLVTVDQWVAMFKELGLTEEQMQQWHRIFEKKHPQGHQNFLAWLGLSKEKIEEIRKHSA